MCYLPLVRSLGILLVIICISVINCDCFCNICRISVELQREANVSKLHHANIVALFATVCQPDHYGIVMEYVLYGALDDYILSNSVCCSLLFVQTYTFFIVFFLNLVLIEVYSK